MRSPLRAKVDAEVQQGVATCTVVEAELRYGMAKGGSAQRLGAPEAFLSLVTILPFDSAAAKEYGLLRAVLERAGSRIGPNDLMIASIALANGLTLVTHNVAEFSRVPGLRIEDWQT